MDFWLFIISLGAMNAFMTTGYNVVFGKGKILHFGHQAHSLIVAYVIWSLAINFGWPLTSAILMGALSALVTSFALSFLSLRLDEDALGVMSIALHLIVFSVVLNWQSVTRGALGIPGITRIEPLQSQLGFTVTLLVLLSCWMLLLWWYNQSRFGRGLQALAEGEWYAQSLGINKATAHHVAFLISGIAALIVGCLYPMFVFLITPHDYNFPSMILYVMMIIAGGPGKVWGVLVATFAIIFLKEGLRFIGMPTELIGPVRLILFGAVMYVVIWLRKETLFPKQRSI